MIHLFHGDDTFKSRQSLLDALTKYQEADFVSAREISDELLVSSGRGLFSEGKKALILNNLFSLHQAKAGRIIAQIKKLADEADFYLWEEKKLTPAKTALLGEKAKISFFRLPAVIFQFLDSLGANDPASSLTLLKKTLKTHPPELVFFLIKRRARELFLAKAAPNQLRGASWQKGKIFNQAGKITLDRAKEFYLQLIETELKNKTGQLGNSLKNELFNLVLLISGKR